MGKLNFKNDLCDDIKNHPEIVFIFDN